MKLAGQVISQNLYSFKIATVKTFLDLKHVLNDRKYLTVSPQMAAILICSHHPNLRYAAGEKFFSRISLFDGRSEVFITHIRTSIFGVKYSRME